MDERLRFVARLLEGEAMSEVCRSFGISRKTGYKIFNRYKEHGVEALCDRSRRPWRYANQLPLQVESLIVRAKREKPHWGARKIRELLVKRLAGDVRIPAQSTVHAVLGQLGAPEIVATADHHGDLPSVGDDLGDLPGDRRDDVGVDAQPGTAGEDLTAQLEQDPLPAALGRRLPPLHRQPWPTLKRANFCTVTPLSAR